MLDLIRKEIIYYLWTAGRRADDMVPAQEVMMSLALQRSDRQVLQILYKVLRHAICDFLGKRGLKCSAPLDFVFIPVCDGTWPRFLLKILKISKSK